MEIFKFVIIIKFEASLRNYLPPGVFFTTTAKNH